MNYCRRSLPEGKRYASFGGGEWGNGINWGESKVRSSERDFSPSRRTKEAELISQEAAQLHPQVQQSERQSSQSVQSSALPAQSLWVSMRPTDATEELSSSSKQHTSTHGMTAARRHTHDIHSEMREILRRGKRLYDWRCFVTSNARYRLEASSATK